MWTIPKTIGTTNNRKLKAFELSDLNVQATFFKAKPGLTFTPDQNNPVTQNPSTPNIIKNDDPVSPIAEIFFYQLEGEWEITGLTRVFGINQVYLNTYLWLDGVTYIFADLTERSYKGKQELDFFSNQLGIIENIEGLTKITANGLSLDFTVNLENEVTIIPSNKPSCNAKFGDVLNLLFDFQYPTSTIETKKALFFSKTGLGISWVTYFVYNGKNYFANSNNQFDLNSVTNSGQNSFFILD